MKTGLLAIIFCTGALFTVQCDRNPDTDLDNTDRDQQELGMDPEDRRYDGTGDQQQTGQALHYDDRDELISDMEALRDDLDEELERYSEADDEESQQIHTQIQNDRTELETALRNLETTTEDGWNTDGPDAQQVYERVRANYEERNATTRSYHNID